MSIRGTERRVRRAARSSVNGAVVPTYDGLYFAGLGRSLLGPNSGITTFEDADRLLSVFLGRPVSTDASRPGRV
jgi:hypothetical protein